MISAGERPSRLRFVRVEVPLRNAHHSAREAELVRDVVLVEWTRADGISGWGECPTLGTDAYVTGSTDAAWEALTTSVGPASLGGRPIADTGPVAAVGAVRDARLDAWLRSQGMSLASHLASSRRTVPRTKVIADVGGEPAAVAEIARSAVDAGARMIKVKISPGDDLERVRAVRDAVGAVPVAADANGSYASRSQVEALDRLGLAYLEQPFPSDLGWEDLAELQHGLRTPVALDESISSVTDLVEAAGAGAIGVVSLKPARLGGIEAALGVGMRAAGLGVAAFVGGMLELAIGRAGAAALAANTCCALPTDLGPSSDYVVDDIAEPVVVDGDGDLVVPHGPGNGRVPSVELLRSVTSAELSLG